MRRVPYGKPRENKKCFLCVPRVNAFLCEANKKRITRGSYPWQSVKIRGKDFAKRKFRPKKSNAAQGPATPGPHCSCVPVLPASPRRRRHDRFSPTAPASGRHFCRSQLPARHLETTSRQPSRGQQFRPLQRAGREEAATPGQPAALARVAGCSPGDRLRAVTGYRWLCRNHAANQERSRFAATHSPILCCALQHKNSAHLCTSCGRTVFLVEAVGKVNNNLRTTRAVFPLETPATHPCGGNAACAGAGTTNEAVQGAVA